MAGKISGTAASSSMEMKGLSTFISDIRACRSRETEEKRINKELGHIRQKFKDGTLSGYDRKKYVCKLLYIYILGYPVDFGHVEAANLLNSSKYKEKYIGYLAVTLLFNENSDTIHLVINSFKKDLDLDSDLVNSLVLSSIANIGGTIFAETLGQDVFHKLTSASSSSFVKKKAALCLLKLYRRCPETFELQEWPNRLAPLINHSDSGVATSAASLILRLCSDDPSLWNVVVSKSIDRLSQIVLQRSFEAHDTYYKVPVPWLQIKLMRILQLFDVSSLSAGLESMTKVFQSIAASVAEQPKGQQHANALNAIFFEAIRLAFHWRISPTSSFFVDSSKILIRFLTTKDLNARYLALDTFSLMLNAGIQVPILFEQQSAIIVACNDRDVSVRQQALDVLYRMATERNGSEIVSELLAILKSSDSSMKEVLVLRIAILTEKFAPSFDWYFRTMFEVLVEASTFASDDVWYRIVQRFSALPPSDNVQELMLLVFNHIVSTSCPDRLLQLCVYLIGERGDVLCSNNLDPSITPLRIFESIHQHYVYSNSQTKCILLTAYLKIFNFFPEIRPLFETVLNANVQELDVELQERAWEYLILLREPDSVLATACEQMPSYSDRGSELESRLAEREQKKHAIAVKPATPTRSADQSFDSKQNCRIGGDQNLLEIVDEPVGASLPPITLVKDPSLLAFFTGPSGGSAGVLYNDKVIEVGAIVDYSGKNGLANIFVYFGNRTAYPIEGLNVRVEGPSSVSIKVSEPSKSVGPGQQERMGVVCTFHDATPTPIAMRVKYSIPGSPVIEHTVRLPAWILYFGEPIRANGDQFVGQWNRCEKFAHVSHVDGVNQPLSAEWLRSVLHKFQWGIVGNCDSMTVRGAAKFTLAAPAEPMFALVQVSFQSNMMTCNIEARSFPKSALAVAIAEVLEFLVRNSAAGQII